MKRKLLCTLLVLLVLCTGLTTAMAAAVPVSREIEDTRTYDSGTLRVTIEQWCYKYKNTALRFFVADVYMTRPDQMRTAFAGEEYSKNKAEATSAIAARHDAVLAINGDYYNYKDNYGLIIRNGVLYRDKKSNCDQLLVFADGSFRAIPKGQYVEGTAKQYLDMGVVQSFSFGPLLVNDGQIVEMPSKYVISTKDTIREPRTAIGIVENNHYIVLVADGRRDKWSDKGMTLQEMQEFFQQRCARIAYNMDGGGSATMIMNGERVNKTSGSRERNVSDIIYFVN